MSAPARRSYRHSASPRVIALRLLSLRDHAPLPAGRYWALCHACGRPQVIDQDTRWTLCPPCLTTREREGREWA